MKREMIKLFEELGKNTSSQIISYEGKKRNARTYRDFYQDILSCINRLESLDLKNRRVGIIGPTSYQWMVLDYACMKGGFHSIAIPEFFDQAAIQLIIKENHADIVLIDHSLKERLSDVGSCYFFNCRQETEARNFDLLSSEKTVRPEREILDEYSTAYTSGTSEKAKKINLIFPVLDQSKKKGIRAYIRSLVSLYYYKRSFMSKKDNKIIIYMPFSHAQQRNFAIWSLFRKFNILLSNPNECIRHLVLEKPNIMISVPVIYEALALRIQEKLNRFSKSRKLAHSLYTKTAIHTFSPRNPVKKICDRLLFGEISKIYGGKPDFFVTGSAPISREVLELYYRIGVRIYEAYGQSETNIIAMNNEKYFKIGSVGKPLEKIKISEDSEILIEYNEKAFQDNREVLNVRNGYIHTGDLGYLDKDGYLFLLGRIDDVILLPNGKKIFPHTLEQKLKKYPNINQALIFATPENKIRAIIHCDMNGKQAGGRSPEAAESHLRNLNAALAPYEQISGYLMIDEPFSTDNGLMTATFKVRRKNVIRKYASQAFKPITA